jgi:hypothetical protein
MWFEDDSYNTALEKLAVCHRVVALRIENPDKINLDLIVQSFPLLEQLQLVREWGLD